MSASVDRRVVGTSSTRTVQVSHHLPSIPRRNQNPLTKGTVTGLGNTLARSAPLQRGDSFGKRIEIFFTKKRVSNTNVYLRH